MKFFILPLFCFCVLISNAQQKDTLTQQEEKLLRLVSGFIKGSMQDVLKENGTPNGIKSVIGNGVKEVMKNTLQKTATALTGQGLNFGKNILLPNVLEQQKTAIINKGKGELLNNFHQSLKDAAANVLVNSIPVFVAQAVEFNADDIVKYATADSLSVTDIFKNANKNALIKIALPIAKTAIKISGGKRMFNKLKKTYKKTTGSKLNFNSEDFLSEAVTDYFLQEMKLQELLLKQNPFSLLDRLKGLLKNVP